MSFIRILGTKVLKDPINFANRTLIVGLTGKNDMEQKMIVLHQVGSMKKVIFLFMALILMVSCVSKEQDALNRLESLTSEIRENHKDYTDSDWNQAYSRYEEIRKEMSQYRYSDGERERIGLLEGECAGYFAVSTLKGLRNSFLQMKHEIKGFISGFKDAIINE